MSSRLESADERAALKKKLNKIMGDNLKTEASEDKSCVLFLGIIKTG